MRAFGYAGPLNGTSGLIAGASACGAAGRAPYACAGPAPKAETRLPKAEVFIALRAETTRAVVLATVRVSVHGPATS